MIVSTMMMICEDEKNVLGKFLYVVKMKRKYLGKKRWMKVKISPHIILLRKKCNLRSFIEAFYHPQNLFILFLKWPSSPPKL